MWFPTNSSVSISSAISKHRFIHSKKKSIQLKMLTIVMECENKKWVRWQTDRQTGRQAGRQGGQNTKEWMVLLKRLVVCWFICATGSVRSWGGSIVCKSGCQGATWNLFQVLPPFHHQLIQCITPRSWIPTVFSLWIDWNRLNLVVFICIVVVVVVYDLEAVSPNWLYDVIVNS